jgi:hypothetical protein
LISDLYNILFYLLEGAVPDQVIEFDSMPPRLDPQPDVVQLELVPLRGVEREAEKSEVS